ncbi:unnamed protein product [Trichobilharzia szidati]|nr:unnamed protein product [Trichobilharzia szidati]
MADETEPGVDSGTTACVAVLVPVKGAVRLYVANAGDSRAVLCRGGAAVDLSVDHKPEDEDEKARIIAAGGTVTRDGRVNGGLNLSRALGDHSYKQTPNIPLTDQMITPSPDVTEIDLIPSADEFLVIACDGVWNSMTSQEVVEFIQDRLHPPPHPLTATATKANNKNNTKSHSKDAGEENGDATEQLTSADKLSKICHEIFDHCLAPNTDGDGTGCDNMTCIIVHFDDLPGWVEHCEKNSAAAGAATDASTVAVENNTVLSTVKSPRKRLTSSSTSCEVVEEDNKTIITTTNNGDTNGGTNPVSLSSSPSQTMPKRPRLEFSNSKDDTDSTITTNGTDNTGVINATAVVSE